MTIHPRDAIVVVVDDDPFIGRLLEAILGGLGWGAVHVHTSAREALLEFDDPQRVALVICDLNMPDVDGIEMLRHLADRKFAGGVLILTGEEGRVLETSGHLASLQGLDLVGALRKPVTKQELGRVLDVWTHSASKPKRARRAAYVAAAVADAIANDQLVNVYQPKVHAETGALVGVETLVRWRHPDDGMVFPDEFISVAEDNDLIDALTRVVLEGALATHVRWRGQGLKLRVAVNVSMDNLATVSFADFVIAALARHGVDPSDLILEVTESRLMRPSAAPLDILARLRLKHVTLSIDDFGTGGSSLVQLRDVPFGELKIDRGFVHEAGHHATNRAIVQASVDMAKKLGIQVVAEGVEDLDDWNFVRAVGIDLVQGYFVGKPMAEDAIGAWLAGWEERRAGLCAVGS